jgi:hypothetical protein
MPTMRSPAVRMTLRPRCLAMLTLLSRGTATSRTLSVVPTRRRRSSFARATRGVPSDRRRCGRNGRSTDARASAMMTLDLYGHPYDHQLDQVAVGTIGGWRSCAGSTTARRQCTRLSRCGPGGFPGVADAGSWSFWPRPKRGCCSNRWWWLQNAGRQPACGIRYDPGSEGPASSERPSGSGRSPNSPPRDRSQTADAAVSGAIITPIGDFRFERHNTEVVDDSRRLHRHGQCRVAADAL